MTTEELIAKQKRIFQQIVEKDAPLRLAAASTLAMQAKRIFQDGKNSDSGNIGAYNSSDPFYINPKTSAGAATGNKKANVSGLGAPRGKTGETKF